MTPLNAAFDIKRVKNSVM